MLLKNLIVYRLSEHWAANAEDMETKLAEQALQPCGSFAMESRGWLPPQDEGGYLYSQHRHWLLNLGIEQKILPTSVVRQLAKDRAAELAAQRGRPLGRKEMRDLRDHVTNELLPRALARRSTTRAWVDAQSRLLVVDAGADKKAEEFVEALRRADTELSCRRLDTQRSAGAAMTSWVSTHDAPHGFTIDQDLELQAQNAGKATVKYVRHALEGKEIRDHIASGKAAMRLGMTWKDKISFVLTDELHVKRINFVNIINEQSESDAVEEAERFDIDFALMTGELSLMMKDLIEALGGEKTAA